MSFLIFASIVLAFLCVALTALYDREKKRNITLKKFLGRISKTAKEVRYGNLSRRLRSSLTAETKSIAKDINNMIETLNDREIMIKSYQGELEKRQQELENMMQMQEDFTATLTHDLKVPILAEINALKLFQDESFGSINENQKYAIDTMLKSNKELLFLVNTLLESSKYCNSEVEIQKRENCLVKAVNECLNEISFLIKEHSISFSPGSEELKIPFDKIEIKRVIKNLLNNAITHTPQDGKISVSIEQSGDFVKLSVSDNGKGISSEDLEKIFKKYYSANKKFRKVGTGLGLFLSKQIIEKHGGEIWVSSELDEGSTFYFKIPLRDTQESLSALNQKS